MESEEPLSTIEGQHPSNHWEKIIKWHAADLDQLPVPPKDFFKRERKALRRRKKRLAFVEAGLRFLALSEEEEQEEKRAAAEPKTRLKDLLPRNKQRALTRPNDGCHNWVLRPTTEKAPEPNAGVPSIVVTTPGGETHWPKDMNPYITKEEVASITERVTKEHDGIMSNLHCQKFHKLYQRGLIEKPYGHRPEILFCTKCCERQMQIEDEEAWLASKGFPRVEEQLGDDQVGMGMILLFPATLKIGTHRQT